MKGWWNDYDDFYEDALDEEENSTKERDRLENIILVDRLPVPAEKINALVFASNYSSYLIKTDDLPGFLFSIKKFLVNIDPMAVNMLCDFVGDCEITQYQGVLLDFKESQFLYEGCYNKIGDNGEFMIIGVTPKDIQYGYGDLIGKMLGENEEVMKLDILSKEFKFDMKIFSEVRMSSQLKPEAIGKEYEPLGTFITNIPLDTFFKESFPATFESLLKGQIKVTNTWERTMIKLAKGLEPNGKILFSRVLRCLNVCDASSTTGSELRMSALFQEEFYKFFFDDPTKDDLEDFEKLYFVDTTKSERTVDKTQDSIRMVIRDD